MDPEKRRRLEEAGFRIGTVAEFLELSPEESELVEVKVALSQAVRQQRCTSNLSQSQLAERLGSSQSRIAKMERGDAGVSLDLLMRALIAQGMTRGKLTEVISGTPLPSAALDDPKPPTRVKRTGQRRTTGKDTPAQAVNASQG